MLQNCPTKLLHLGGLAREHLRRNADTTWQFVQREMDMKALYYFARLLVMMDGPPFFIAQAQACLQTGVF